MRKSPRSVVTLGTFDGVHRGHQAIIKRLVQRAKASGAQSVVMAFAAPPRHVGSKAEKRYLLTTLDEKTAILRQLGVDRVEVLFFTRKLASLSHAAFFEEYVVKRLKAREIVVGPRVAFGKGRSGRLPELRSLGAEHGVKVTLIPTISSGGSTLASRKLRSLIARGEVETAAKALGYRYCVTGTVKRGDGRGRTLGFPTANLKIDPSKVIPSGVYWVKVCSADQPILADSRALRELRDGLCNIGRRPTFYGARGDLSLEVHIPGVERNLYGKRLRLLFMRKIRGEKRFRSGAELVAQIKQDVASAREWSRTFALHRESGSI